MEAAGLSEKKIQKNLVSGEGEGGITAGYLNESLQAWFDNSDYWFHHHLL